MLEKKREKKLLNFKFFFDIQRKKVKMRPLFMSSAKLPIIDKTPGVRNSREEEGERERSSLRKTKKKNRFVYER